MEVSRGFIRRLTLSMAGAVHKAIEAEPITIRGPSTNHRLAGQKRKQSPTSEKSDCSTVDVLLISPKSAGPHGRCRKGDRREFRDVLDRNVDQSSSPIHRLATNALIGSGRRICGVSARRSLQGRRQCVEIWGGMGTQPGTIVMTASTFQSPTDKSRGLKYLLNTSPATVNIDKATTS